MSKPDLDTFKDATKLAYFALKQAKDQGMSEGEAIRAALVVGQFYQAEATILQAKATMLLGEQLERINATLSIKK
jgi:hypothetical protein